MRRDIVFVHIPKTAGTSMRVLLEQLAGSRTVLRDYAGAPETTPELFRLVHSEKHIAAFRETFNREENGILLSGHFPAKRYWEFFNAESFVTFVRNPVDRVISEYVHSVTIKGWTESLEEFAQRLVQRRTLRQFLHGADLDVFGFIGFTEEFDTTLPALGEWLGVEIPMWPRENEGNYAHVTRDLRNDERARALVAELAAVDVEIYERLRRERSHNPRARGATPEIAGQYVGRVELRGTVATGWLFNAAREFISNVEISSAGETVAVVAADRYREASKARGSRSGVCGFEVSLASIIPRARRPVHLSFRAQGTDYELEGSPIEFTPPE